MGLLQLMSAKGRRIRIADELTKGGLRRVLDLFG
jgi:hypothetical protein